jgi:uncharacterized protein
MIQRFNDTELAILTRIYSRPDERIYLRHLIRTLDKGFGGVQRGVQHLHKLGALTFFKSGKRHFYQANTKYCNFDELLKFASARTIESAPRVLKNALRPLKHQIRQAFIFGSVARGDARPDSDVDLLVVGNVDDIALTKALTKAEEKLHREVNPMIYTPARYQELLNDGAHFLTSLGRERKIQLVAQ